MGCGKQTANSKQQTANSKQQTGKQETANGKPEAKPHSRLVVASHSCCLLFAVCCLLRRYPAAGGNELFSLRIESNDVGTERANALIARERQVWANSGLEIL